MRIRAYVNFLAKSRLESSSSVCDVPFLWGEVPSGGEAGRGGGGGALEVQTQRRAQTEAAVGCDGGIKGEGRGDKKADEINIMRREKGKEGENRRRKARLFCRLGSVIKYGRSLRSRATAAAYLY